MNILVITSEVGYDGGGMSLSCSRIINILSGDNSVKVVMSGQYAVVTADGGYSPKNTRMDYSLHPNRKLHSRYSPIACQHRLFSCKGRK